MGRPPQNKGKGMHYKQKDGIVKEQFINCINDDDDVMTEIIKEITVTKNMIITS